MKDIRRLAEEAISDNRFVTLLGRSHLAAQKDVPMVFEVLSLLLHYLEKLPKHEITLSGGKIIPLTEGIYCDSVNSRALLLLSVPAGSLEHIAFWVSETVYSDRMKALPGLLGLAFVVEKHENASWLIPEWWSVFYANNAHDQCFPLLVMRSVLEDERYADWVNVALERMSEFALPTQQAKTATSSTGVGQER